MKRECFVLQVWQRQWFLLPRSVRFQDASRLTEAAQTKCLRFRRVYWSASEASFLLSISHPSWFTDSNLSTLVADRSMAMQRANKMPYRSEIFSVSSIIISLGKVIVSRLVDLSWQSPVESSMKASFLSSICNQELKFYFNNLIINKRNSVSTLSVPYTYTKLQANWSSLFTWHPVASISTHFRNPHTLVYFYSRLLIGVGWTDPTIIFPSNTQLAIWTFFLALTANLPLQRLLSILTGL